MSYSYLSLTAIAEATINMPDFHFSHAEAIFYGRTVESHVSREPEFLLYPDSGQEEEGFHSHGEEILLLMLPVTVATPPTSPPSGYNCREDFIPPPGYENSWVRSVQVQTREMILNSLPEEWARWVCTNVSSCALLTWCDPSPFPHAHSLFPSAPNVGYCDDIYSVHLHHYSTTLPSLSILFGE